MPLYRRFVAAWEKVADRTIWLCFHGTLEGNIGSICRNGLDPARRQGQALGPGEYFAGKAQTSVDYCKGGRKMLVFAVMTDRSGLTALQDQGDQILVISKPDHQLPLFVLSF